MAESAAVRRRTMQAVKSSGTAPEMAVRRAIHAMGYRYRLHRADLPGKPDIVLAGLGAIVFVHGCFWHGHDCPRGSRIPKTNTEYWTAKIARNRLRDKDTRKQLTADGWKVLTIWECQTVGNQLIRRLTRFLTTAAARP